MAKAIDLRPPKIPVMLDRERNIQFDFRALAALESHFGDIPEALTAIEKGGLQMDVLLKALHAGLATDFYHGGDELTIEQLQEYIGFNGLIALGDIILRAFNIAMPEPSEKNVKNPPAGKMTAGGDGND